MPSVDLENVSKRYGAVEVIKGLSLSVARGSFTALLGPSGCGKSTLLRMIAGLEEITSGRCFIEDADVTSTPPAKRGVAMVFQSYALYPHMTVRDNIAFSLSIAGVSRAAQNAKVAEVSRMLQLEPLLDRRPAQLSGGQRQRVAIGRALVRDPKVFLFDEPLSNLDAMLRVQMRLELAKLHRDLKSTMIYVTHDQTEAMTLADQIVVLDKGLVSQVGSPLTLYNTPANRFVASFIGSPGMNFIPVEIENTSEGHAHVRLPGGAVVAIPMRGEKAGGTAEIGVRPEHVAFTDSSDPALVGSVAIVERLGDETLVYVDTAAGQIIVKGEGSMKASLGDNVSLAITTASAHLFGPDGAAM